MGESAATAANGKFFYRPRSLKYYFLQLVLPQKCGNNSNICDCITIMCFKGCKNADFGAYVTILGIKVTDKENLTTA